MEKNHRMVLNEYAQKYSIKLAEYEYSNDETGYFFIAKCRFNGLEAISDNKKTKKEAQEESAKKVYEMVSREYNVNNNSGSEVDFSRGERMSNNNLILLVDLDNQRAFMDVKGDIEYLKFIGVCGPNMNIDSINTWKDTIIKTNSVVKDAADLELVWRVCEVYRSFPESSKVIVISRDFSLKHLEEMLRERGLDAEYYTGYKDFMKVYC